MQQTYCSRVRERNRSSGGRNKPSSLLAGRIRLKQSSGAEYKTAQILFFPNALKLMNLLCWCGNPDLQEYSPDYWRCDVCSTLVAKSFPSIDITAISEEDE